MSMESPIVKNEVQPRESIGKSVSNSSGPYQLTLLSGKNIQYIDRQASGSVVQHTNHSATQVVVERYKTGLEWDRVLTDIRDFPLS